MSDPAIQPELPPAGSPEPAVAPAPRAALTIVFLVVVIDLLGFGIVLPLLPRFGERYVAPLMGTHQPGEPKDWLIAALEGVPLALLMASFSAMQFLFAPVWGRISDRVGRRPILLIGLGGSVVFYLLLGYATELPNSPRSSALLALLLLFAARLGAGIAGATVATAQAVIADCTPPERRKQGMAMIGAAFGIGFTIGPLVGFAALGLFPEHPGAVGFSAAALSLVALVLGMVKMPETRNFTAAPPLDRKWFDVQGIRNALRSRAVGPVVLAFFLASLGFASFEVTLSLFNQDALGLKDRNNFLVFFYLGVVLILTQGLLYRWLASFVSEPTFMAVGMLLMGLGVGCLAGVQWLAAGNYTSFGMLVAIHLFTLTVAVVGFAFLTPSAQALISRRSDPARQGEVLGVNQSAAALARILGPLLGLPLYKATSTHMLPYFFGGALLLLMLPLIPVIRRG
jgi:MFS family permease